MTRRTPYPPFLEDDWRTIAGGEIPERHQLVVAQLTHDATTDHQEKHRHADHPFCQWCHIRGEYDLAGSEPVTPRAARETFTATASTQPTPAQVEAFRTAYKAGDLDNDDPTTYPPTGLTEDDGRALATLIDHEETWNYDVAEAKRDTAGRAARWMVVHRTPPTSCPPPGPEHDASSLDDLYLDRDGLRDLPTVEQLIDGILPRHSYGLLIGRDGTYKTFIALDWALSIATGRDWQGRPTEKARVLYVAGEGAYGIEARVNAWEKAWHRDVDPHMFTVRAAALNLHKTGPDFDHLLQTVTDGEYGLVILDTLRRVSGQADGNGSDMGTVIDNIDKIRRATTNGAVLTIAHTAKDDRDSRGYSGIEDDADFVWHAKRPDDDQRVELKNKKNKNGPDGARLELQATPAHESLVIEALTGTTGTVIVTENQTKIVASLRDTFPDGASPTQLMADSGVPESSFYRTIRQLEKNGHVTNTGSPSRKHWTLTARESETP